MRSESGLITRRYRGALSLTAAREPAFYPCLSPMIGSDGSGQGDWRWWATVGGPRTGERRGESAGLARTLAGDATRGNPGGRHRRGRSAWAALSTHSSARARRADCRSSRLTVGSRTERAGLMRCWGIGPNAGVRARPAIRPSPRLSSSSSTPRSAISCTRRSTADARRPHRFKAGVLCLPSRNRSQPGSTGIPPAAGALVVGRAAAMSV